MQEGRGCLPALLELRGLQASKILAGFRGGLIGDITANLNADLFFSADLFLGAGLFLSAGLFFSADLFLSAGLLVQISE